MPNEKLISRQIIVGNLKIQDPREGLTLVQLLEEYWKFIVFTDFSIEVSYFTYSIIKMPVTL